MLWKNHCEDRLFAELSRKVVKVEVTIVCLKLNWYQGNARCSSLVNWLITHGRYSMNRHQDRSRCRRLNSPVMGSCTSDQHRINLSFCKLFRQPIVPGSTCRALHHDKSRFFRSVRAVMLPGRSLRARHHDKSSFCSPISELILSDSFSNCRQPDKSSCSPSFPSTCVKQVMNPMQLGRSFNLAQRRRSSRFRLAKALMSQGRAVRS
mmetsp:Transcript_16735/g.50010  ORF Transcript_16735/g.50010 Transcript_16735/m.50010 type:complete len:207 (-) Transcript_16735:796-1416(-)